MIKLSEMYRISGGCVPFKTCDECKNYVSGRNAICIVYPKEINFKWNPKAIACKYFREYNENTGQMDISDLFKEVVKNGENSG